MMLFAAGLLCLISLTSAQERCGRHSARYFDQENYIVGGRNVQLADSVVSLQVFKSDEWWNDHDWKHTCGGVLLNKRWVLTAAHCVKEARGWGTARIVLGTNNIKSSAPNRQEIPVRRMLEHPEWSPLTRTNDVALIELGKDAYLNDDVSPACVNSYFGDVVEYESCAVLGWGKLDELSEFSDDLKVVFLNRMTYPQCMRAYRNVNGVRISEKFHICAGRMGERGKGICQGDLGGPLYCRTHAGVQLVGIATNGAACGSPQHPGIFIRVDNFVQWIRETTNDPSIGDKDLQKKLDDEEVTRKQEEEDRKKEEAERKKKLEEEDREKHEEERKREESEKRNIEKQREEAEKKRKEEKHDMWEQAELEKRREADMRWKQEEDDSKKQAEEIERDWAEERQGQEEDERKRQEKDVKKKPGMVEN